MGKKIYIESANGVKWILEIKEGDPKELMDYFEAVIEEAFETDYYNN